MNGIRLHPEMSIDKHLVLFVCCIMITQRQHIEV